MNKLYRLIIILIITPFYTSAQTEKLEHTDSLILNIGELPEDTNKVIALIEITDNLKETDYDKALYYGNKALDLSEKLNYKRGISQALYYIAWTYHNKADYKSTMSTLLKKMKIDKELGSKNQIASNYNFIGNIYHRTKNFKKSLRRLVG